MRFFFWQGGLHIRPENNEEDQVLSAAANFLKEWKFGHGIECREVRGIQGRNQEPVRLGSKEGLTANELDQFLRFPV